MRWLWHQSYITLVPITITSAARPRVGWVPRALLLVRLLLPSVRQRENMKRKSEAVAAAAPMIGKRVRRKPTYIPRSVAVVGTERKYFDSFLNNFAIPASTDWQGTEADPATLNCLFCPTEGSDLDNRVGRRVNVRRIQLRGMFSCASQTDQTAADTAMVIRVILVQDMQTNGQQVQGETVMAAPGAASAALTVNTFQNPANFGRFRVLKDKTYKLEQADMVWDGTNVEQSGYNHPFKLTVGFSRPNFVRFNATNGGTVADIVDNSFHLIVCANVISLAPKLYYQCRVVYTDA